MLRRARYCRFLRYVRQTLGSSGSLKASSPRFPKACVGDSSMTKSSANNPWVATSNDTANTVAIEVLWRVAAVRDTRHLTFRLWRKVRGAQRHATFVAHEPVVRAQRANGMGVCVHFLSSKTVRTSPATSKTLPTASRGNANQANAPAVASAWYALAQVFGFPTATQKVVTASPQATRPAKQDQLRHRRSLCSRSSGSSSLARMWSHLLRSNY